MEWFLSRNPFAREWIPVSPDEARAHRYYGFRGWLLALYVGYAYGFVVNLFGIFAPGLSAGLGLAQTILLVQNALGVPFLVLAPIKHPLMPKAVIGSLWIGVALFAATVDIQGNVDREILLVAIAAGIAASMTWYFLWSKRVNVTYRHRVPAGGDPTIHTTAADQKIHNRVRVFWTFAGIIAVIILIGLFVDRVLTNY